MTESNPAPQIRLGPVERVIATGIATLAFSMLSWLVYTNNQNTVTIAMIQKDITYIQTDIKTVKDSNTNQYSKVAATELERRVAKVEQKLGL